MRHIGKPQPTLPFMRGGYSITILRQYEFSEAWMDRLLESLAYVFRVYTMIDFSELDRSNQLACMEQIWADKWKGGINK